jgi:hypothetical protein
LLYHTGIPRRTFRATAGIHNTLWYHTGIPRRTFRATAGIHNTLWYHTGIPRPTFRATAGIHSNLDRLPSSVVRYGLSLNMIFCRMHWLFNIILIIFYPLSEYVYALNIVDGDAKISAGDDVDILNIHICDNVIIKIIQIWLCVC